MKSNLDLKEIFKLALKNHHKKNFENAQDLYNQILKIEPENIITINNLGAIFLTLGDYHKAKKYFEKAIKIDPKNIDANNNLGVTYKVLGENHKAINCYKEVLKIDHNYVAAYNNLGQIFYKLKEYNKAKDYFEKAIEINHNYKDSYNNLGTLLIEFGQYQKAISCYKKTIEIDPKYLLGYYNLGVIFNEYLGDLKKSKECCEKVIEIDVNYSDAYWNLYVLASDIDEALPLLNKINEIDKNHIKSKIIISALKGYKGNFSQFNNLLKTSNVNHPYTRSVKWVFSLPKLPKIFFNRWDFFDAVILLSDNSRPFYEFGVWRGVSFKYLANTFERGFGFDTFTGLPENWHNEVQGSYSSFGAVPKIKGGEFIVGKFEDTLPKFFSKEQPMASLINFDADLYSSTLCALNYAYKVMDKKTILIFDEFIMNENWEQDEFKALNDFCVNMGISYEVIAISFSSKQVAIRLNK